MKTLAIFGTGGFAREVGDVALELGYSPLYVARDAQELAGWRFPADAVLEAELARWPDLQYAIGIGDNAVRERVARAADRRFVNLIHPSASFGHGQRAALEQRQGMVVCAGVRLTNQIALGDFSIFNLNATVGHDAVLGPFVNVAPGANISGNVEIGARCWIGTGAAINQGREGARLTIGADTVIGSGSVVVKDCEPNAVYAGVPAKRIK